jgi:hypothetical protein
MTMMKPLSIFVLCIGVGSIALVLPEATHTNVLRAQPFFVDDFEDEDTTDGRPVNWLPGRFMDGDADASAGDFVLTGSNVSFYVPQSVALQDVSVRTQLRFQASSGNAQIAYVFARSSMGDGYAGAIQQDGQLLIVEAPQTLPRLHCRRLQRRSIRLTETCC